MNYTEWTFNGKSPIYIQVYQKFQHSVFNGHLQPGESVPSIRQMSSILHININTVAKAYKLINQDGLIQMPRGRKCFVTPNSIFIQEKRAQEAKLLRCNYIRSMEALGFSEKEAQTFIQEYRNYED